MATAALPPITSLGSGSNLPLQDVLDKLSDNEKLQLTQIKNQQTQVTSQISAYGQLQSAVEALQTAAQGLSDPKTFAATKATVTGTDFTATTDTGAVPNNYTVKVEQLATGQSLRSGPVADRKAQIGAGGTITVSLADGTSQTVTLGADHSLNGVAASINGDDKLGMTASIVTDGDGNSYLMVASKNTGTKAAVTSIVASDSALNSQIGYTQGSPSPMTQVGAGPQDAKLQINGVEIVSGSNTIDKAIDDVTITLTAASNTDNTLSMTTDTSAQSNAVKGFVSAYNALRGLIASDTAFDADTDQSSVLTGDATVRSIQNLLANALQVLTSGGNINTIQDLGISTDTSTKDGLLKLDSDALDSALKANPLDVQNIIGGTGGLGDLMTKAANVILGSNGDNGMLAARTDGLSLTSKTLQETFDSTQDRIDADIANIRAKFVTLDSFVAQMNSTSTYLTQQFASLSQQK
jgi:flagellar hook-associated protein 2